MSIETIAKRYVSDVGGVITALRVIQSKLGYLPEDTEAVVADVFNLSRAEVLGVISFYSDFTRTPPTKMKVKVCAAEACQAVGGRKLESDLVEAVKGTVEIEHIFCLGLCSVAPAAMIEDELVGRADVGKIMDAIERREEGST